MHATAHALLRDRGRWRGHMRGVSVDRDGALRLVRTPHPGDATPVVFDAAYPYVREVSGIVPGPCGALFVAQTALHRILYIDGRCGTHIELPHRVDPDVDAPGHFRSPRGLALAHTGLVVADSGNARVQHLAFPRLEASSAAGELREPTSLALDSSQRLLVVDAASRRVRRLLPSGQLDADFDARLMAQHKVRSPVFVAADDADGVLVSDASANEVFVFDAKGAFARSLEGTAGWMPGAIAVDRARIYVADAASGAILVFDDFALQGELAGWRGPVTALAVGDNGDLYVKPGLDAAYFRLTAKTAFVSRGELLAGPFDAGEKQTWERVRIESSTPAGTSLDVDIALRSTANAPLQADWRTLPAHDALLAPLADRGGRFAWLRLRLATTSTGASPAVAQARLATAGEDYLDYLPLTYRQGDGANGPLSRWLKLIRSEFGQVEESLDLLPRLVDPQLASPDTLPWLAQWLALELPHVADDAQKRALIERAVQLFARRGTRSSIAELVELHTGIRPAIVEAFSERRVWALGVSSRLDFDTRLASLDPVGVVVPDTAEGGCCPGAIGRAVVSEGGPIADYQIGLPLFAEAAYRFCVVVNGYRLREPGLLAELRRIVDREKPAHTDYRIDIIAPEMRVGFQSRIGIDAIVGGEMPQWMLAPAELGLDTRLPPMDVARVGEAALDGTLVLT